MGILLNKQRVNILILGNSFFSFTEYRGQPLTDLSLYISSQNYYANTLPAYSDLLQWPKSWIIPPKIRAAARNRTSHLGLSSLDVDAAAEEDRERQTTPGADQVPQSLLTKPKMTVSSLLGQTAHRSQFRLDSVTAQFCEPLQELLGKKTYLLKGPGATSLDCLVLGYVSLGLVPELEFPWLRDALRKHSPTLSKWADEFRKRCFGVAAVTVSDAFPTASTETRPQPGNTTSLPWQAPQRPSLRAVGGLLYDNVADSIPVWSELRANNRLKQDVAETELEDLERRELSKVLESGRRETLVSTATVVAGVAAFVGYLFYSGLLSVGGGEWEDVGEGEDVADGAGHEHSYEPNPNSSFGAAGSILGI